MASYTALTREEAESILRLYGYQSVIALEPKSLGISNSNYKVLLKEHPPLLLKVSNDKSPTQLQEEMVILEALREWKFPYSLRPLSTLQGEMTYHWNDYFGVLFPYVAGVVPTVTEQSCFTLGQGLARLHRSSEQCSQPEGLRHYKDIGFDSQKIQDYADLASHCPDDFRLAFQQLFPQGRAAFADLSFPCGIIHGDLYYDNALFNQQGELQVLLDFEQAGWGEFIFDIGTAISGTCLQGNQLVQHLIQAYLQGYESERQLTKLEKKFLDPAILLGLFSIALWRIKRFKEGDLDKSRSESYQELIQRALDYATGI